MTAKIERKRTSQRDKDIVYRVTLDDGSICTFTGIPRRWCKMSEHDQDEGALQFARHKWQVRVDAITLTE